MNIKDLEKIALGDQSNIFTQKAKEFLALWIEYQRAQQSQDEKHYRFDMQGAYNAGHKEHPQIVIRKFAPHAFNFEPVSIGDCWMFDAPEIINPPEFIMRINK